MNNEQFNYFTKHNDNNLAPALTALIDEEIDKHDIIN